MLYSVRLQPYIFKEQSYLSLNRLKSDPALAGPRLNLFGGASRDRTDDLLLAKQALSQLSYGPVR